VALIVKMLKDEESVRVKNKTAEGMMQRGWTIPEELRDELRIALRDTSGYTVGDNGKIVKGSVGYA
jgi:hypothetical protein